MQRLFHHSLHVEYTLFPKKLKWLFAAQLLRGGAQQMAGIFIPLYLYFRVPFFDFFRNPFFAAFSDLQKAMVLICGFFFLIRVTTLLVGFPLVRFIKKIGLTKSMVVGNFFNMCMYLALYMTNTYPAFLALAAIFSGLTIVLYWIPYYTEFAVNAELRKLGQDVGALSFLDKLARVSMPMIGGVIAATAGFRALHLISAAFFFFATCALFLVHDVHVSSAVSFREFFRWLREPKFQKISMGFIGRYIDDAVFTIWPIFVFLIVGTVERVGFLYSLVLFFSLVAAYFMGWYLGKHRGRRLLMLSGGALSLIWAARSFVQQIWHIIAVDLADRLTVGVYEPVFDALFLRTSRSKHVFQFQVYREVVNSLAGLAVWSIILLFFLIPVGWTAVFLLASFGVLLSTFLDGRVYEP